MKAKATPGLLWLMIAVYIAFFGIVTALRHAHFQTQAWDMGIFDQLYWNLLHGNGFSSSIEELPRHFGIHMSPTLLLLAPLYALFPSPYFLLFIQTAALGFAAWPLFLLARNALHNEKAALSVAAAYLLYPALHWINLYDFHEIALYVPAAIAAFYCIEEACWGWATFFLLLAAGTKEDAILGIFFIGTYVLFKKSAGGADSARRRIFGVAAAAVAIAYFLLSIKVLMPAFGGGLLRLDRYAHLGNSFSEIAKNSVSNPALMFSTIFTPPKISYLFWLFLPTAFLPLMAPSSLLLLLPGIPENLLTNFSAQFSGLYQYDAILIPGIFIGTIFGLKYLLRTFPRFEKNILRLFLGFALAGCILRSPINPAFFPKGLSGPDSKRDAYQAMIAAVPPKASVAANTNLVPHLTHRALIAQLGAERFQPDFILIDGADSFGFENDDRFNAYFDRYANSGLYDTSVIEDRYALLKRK